MQATEGRQLWSEPEKAAFMKVVILGRAYREALQLFLTTCFFNVILAIIVLTFILINGKSLPLILLCALLVAEVIATATASFLFRISTDLHISSKEFIQISAEQANGRSGLDSKFWKGMKPLKIDVAQVCSFETREFLLFIWGEVIISRIIDLLIAF